MSKLAIYPGSFDPLTNGHLDILQRALRIFDKVVIAVAQNGAKTALFSPEERADLVRTAVKDMKNVEVDLFSGLLVDYARRRNAPAVVRGLRAVADFEYEFQLALMNRKLYPEVNTVFLMTDQRYLYVSSSMVKEVASLGGEIDCLVPSVVSQALKQKLQATATR